MRLIEVDSGIIIVVPASLEVVGDKNVVPMIKFQHEIVCRPRTNSVL